jgi:ubiquinone/menaquinone biosynthesis C-methylase UbiE
MNNRWNRFVYKLWSPIYDYFFNKGMFHAARKRVFNTLQLKDDQNILLVGVGTGADIEFIVNQQNNFSLTGIDFSPEMLQRARLKYQDPRIEFEVMDAQSLLYQDGTVDVVIASLIVSVVPDANLCLQEMLRVVRHGGEIIIFDKFVPKGRKLSVTKKMIRPIIRLLGTDIGLSLEELLKPYSEQLEIVEDEPVLFNGMYRKIVLRKKR